MSKKGFAGNAYNYFSYAAKEVLTFGKQESKIRRYDHNQPFFEM